MNYVGVNFVSTTVAQICQQTQQITGIRLLHIVWKDTRATKPVSWGEKVPFSMWIYSLDLILLNTSKVPLLIRFLRNNFEQIKTYHLFFDEYLTSEYKNKRLDDKSSCHMSGGTPCQSYIFFLQRFKWQVKHTKLMTTWERVDKVFFGLKWNSTVPFPAIKPIKNKKIKK